MTKSGRNRVNKGLTYAQGFKISIILEILPIQTFYGIAVTCTLRATGIIVKYQLYLLFVYVTRFQTMQILDPYGMALNLLKSLL